LAPVTRATARRSVVGDDLQLDAAAVARAHDPQQAANRIGDATVAADDAAHVALVDAQHELHFVATLLHLDVDRVGVVDQRARDIVEELLHSATVASAAASASGAAAASAGACVFDAGFALRAGRFLAGAAGAGDVVAEPMPAWRMSLATVSDGVAPFSIQALSFSASIWTVAGSVSGL
jgi:hypothetical protein